MADDFEPRELTVTEEEDGYIVTNASGERLATFHMENWEAAPLWEAFIDGLARKFPTVSVFNRSRGRYHICDGVKWLEDEGRYETDDEAAAARTCSAEGP